jgi:alpha-1,6-mannosyltransferase
MSIKTLHLTNNWHAESGGVATFYRELLNGAERLRREIRLVVPGPKEGVEAHGRYGKIYTVAASPSRLSPGYCLMMPGQYLWPHSPIRRILEEERADLVECCDKYTLNYLAALLRRGWLLGRDYRPAVIGLTCERMDRNMALYVSQSSAAERFCRFYMKWLHFPMFDHHIAVSPLAADELALAAHGHSTRRGVWVRPMGASCDVFHPRRRTASARRWLESVSGAEEDGVLLLYAGRLAPEKNLELLGDTMVLLDRRYPGRFHLLVAGDGPQRADFEDRCRRRIPAAVRFLGHVRDRETLAMIYANCDVFLHPNPREPFGIAPLEAMASGLAVVGPDSGGITCFAKNDNAWLVKPEAEAFAGAVESIAVAPEEAEHKRHAARATAEQFDWPRVTDEFFQLYDELYAVVAGEQRAPRLEPAFYSTPGNRLGCEI